MDIETVRAYCLSLPQATEDFPFDESTLAFRIGGKFFAMLHLENTDWFVLKCNPEYAIDLRDQHLEIAGAWHMNKKYWNQLNLSGGLTDDFIRQWIRHSYNEVLLKMSKKQRESLQLELLPFP